MNQIISAKAAHPCSLMNYTVLHILRGLIIHSAHNPCIQSASRKQPAGMAHSHTISLVSNCLSSGAPPAFPYSVSAPPFSERPARPPPLTGGASHCGENKSKFNDTSTGRDARHASAPNSAHCRPERDQPIGDKHQDSIGPQIGCSESAQPPSAPPPPPPPPPRSLVDRRASGANPWPAP